MAEDRIVPWDGKSGKKYNYWIYEIGQSFEHVPGNYCFAKEVNPHKWIPIYFEETSDLSELFGDHHRIPDVQREGATHIHTHTGNASKEARLAEEADLVEKWHPEYND